MSWLDPLKLNGKVQLTALIQYINILSLWIDLSILVVEQRSWPFDYTAVTLHKFL